MFALPISMPRFKSITFCQNSPKSKLILQKNAKFKELGAKPRDSRASDGCGFFPRPPASGGWELHCKFLATRLVCKLQKRIAKCRRELLSTKNILHRAGQPC